MGDVEQVAKASLFAIMAQGADAPLAADDFNDYIFALNNYMLALDAKGIALGYTVVDSINDEITVPPGAILGIIANVAILVSPDYGGSVSPELIANAKLGMDAMRRLGLRIIPSRFPSTLPIGSGNEDNGTFRNGHFYRGTDAAVVLAETVGCVLREAGTNGAATE